MRFLAPPAKACLDRCGEGTRCSGGAASRRRRGRRAAGVRPRGAGSRAGGARSGDGEAGRPPTAAERELRSEGPSLQGIDFIKAAEGGDERELSTAEIDARVHALDARVVDCIDRARGQIDFREGQVVLAFRIERSGRVDKVQVSAPAALQLPASTLACAPWRPRSASRPRAGRW